MIAAVSILIGGVATNLWQKAVSAGALLIFLILVACQDRRGVPRHQARLAKENDWLREEQNAVHIKQPVPHYGCSVRVNLVLQLE